VAGAKQGVENYQKAQRGLEAALRASLAMRRAASEQVGR
jgi:hypothetical protein